MKLFVAAILLGQVGTDSYSPRASTGPFSPRAAISDQNVSDQPSPPAADAYARQRPSAQFSGTAEPTSTPLENSPSRRSSPASPRGSAQSSNHRQHHASEPPPAASSDASRYAAELLENLLTWDEKSQEPIRKVRLIDAISRLPDAQNRATAIGTYWELALAVSRARYAHDKVQILLAVPASNDPNDRALLEAAVATAEVNEAAAQDSLLAAQYRLIRAAGLTWDGTLPWPADAPLAGPYRTNFDSHFAQRIPPLELRHIHQSLPGKLRLIERCVVAVSAAETAADTMLESYKQGRSSISQLLQTFDRLESSQQAFLTAVVDYNGRIAEYSIAAVGPSIGPETLVSTLIKTSNSNTSLATVPREVRQAAAEAPVLSSDDGTVQR